MSDYTPITNFTTKDGLTTGDAEKIILGSDIDAETAAIASAISSKYDVTDLASQAEAEAGTSSSKLMTPERVEQAMDALLTAGNGVSISNRVWSLNITGLTNETTLASDDEFVFYDATASAHRALTYAGLGTALGTLHAGTASATGLSSSSGVLTLDLDALTNVTPAATDEFVVADASDSGLPKAVLFSALESALNHDSLTGFASDEHIAHSGVTLTAGTGLTGGGSIAASRTFNLDISGLTAMSATPVGTDGFLYDDAGTMKRMSYNQLAFPSRNVASSGNFASTDVGTVVYWTGTTGTLTMPTGVGQDEAAIIVINSGSGTLTIAGSSVTITSANSLTDIPAGGMACLIRETSTVWFLGGSLE